MLRFDLIRSNGVVSIDPNAVASVTETTLAYLGKAEDVAVISLVNGKRFTVFDPDHTIVKQIEAGKRK